MALLPTGLFLAQATTERTIPTTSDTYTEAESGMLHLQSGALVRAIPTIENTLPVSLADVVSDDVDVVSDNNDVAISIGVSNTTDYFIDEGGVGERTTVTFTVTRTPTNYDVETTSFVTITNTAGGDPAGLGLWFGEDIFSGDLDTIGQTITFARGEDEQTIIFTFTGNDLPNPDGNHVYTISIEPTAIPGGGSQQITFTIEDDDEAPPVIDFGPIVGGTGTTIYETAVEYDDGNVRDFANIAAYRSRTISQNSTLLFAVSDLQILLLPMVAQVAVIQRLL